MKPTVKGLRHITTKGYNYLFNPKTGMTIRYGDELSEDPFMAPVPELADISINNVCDRGCEFCYKNSNMKGKTMSLQDYEEVLRNLPLTWQLALGGGEPTLHPDFIEILRMTREDYDKIPNYTTNGIHLTDAIIKASKEYCGAVAVSYNEVDDIWVEAIRRFIEAGVKTNIHFVVSEETFQIGMNLLTALAVTPEVYGISDLNAIVFLLYKPVGRADRSKQLTKESAMQFLEYVFAQDEVKIGFDTCFMKHIRDAEQAEKISMSWEQVDTCESGRFSVYVSEDLEVIPCSFGCSSDYKESLRERPLKDIWFGKKFESFRKVLEDDCFSCPVIGSEVK